MSMRFHKYVFGEVTVFVGICSNSQNRLNVTHLRHHLQKCQRVEQEYQNGLIFNRSTPSQTPCWWHLIPLIYLLWDLVQHQITDISPQKYIHNSRRSIARISKREITNDFHLLMTPLGITIISISMVDSWDGFTIHFSVPNVDDVIIWLTPWIDMDAID